MLTHAEKGYDAVNTQPPKHNKPLTYNQSQDWIRFLYLWKLSMYLKNICYINSDIFNTERLHNQNVLTPSFENMFVKGDNCPGLILKCWLIPPNMLSLHSDCVTWHRLYFHGPFSLLSAITSPVKEKTEISSHLSPVFHLFLATKQMSMTDNPTSFLSILIFMIRKKGEGFKSLRMKCFPTFHNLNLSFFALSLSCSFFC